MNGLIGKLSGIRGLLGKLDSGSAVIVVMGMAVRGVFAAVAWNADYGAFAGWGSAAYHNPGIVFGVYTVPAYFLAGFYAIWIVLPIVHSDSSYNFAMKVPSLIFDFLTALLIYRILSQTNLGKSRIHWALAAWLLNPLTLIAGGANFVEVVPAFLLLLSSFLAAQKKLLSASVALTAGGLLRLVPFISLPFLMAIPIRTRDWKGAIKTVLPVGLVAVGVLVWTVLVNPNLFATLAAGGGGVSRAEIFDLMGVELSTNIVPYPANTVAMTALAYLLLLVGVLVLPRNQSHVIAKELYFPILAYLAFSFTAGSFFMYAIPFALILMANFKGYKVPIVFMSIVGCLWTAVRSPDYLAQPTYLFSIPCYSQYLNLCNLTGPFYQWELLLQSYLRPQITAAWTALLVFLVVMSLTQGGIQGMLQSLEKVRSRSK